MNKNEFLNDPVVQSFKDWFVSIFESGFYHKYCLIPKGKKPVTEFWSCTSIYNAFEQYEWEFSYRDLISNQANIISGNTYLDSNNALEKIQKHLRNSVSIENESGAFNACKMVLDWGGVLKRGRKGKTNEDKLSEIRNRFGLISYLCQAEELLALEHASTSGDFIVTDSNNNDEVLLMNSGFTKIYSILVDKFVIFDGRVGAALGFLVSQFKMLYPATNIDVLMFSYGNAAESKKCINNSFRRNPGNEQVRFSNLFQGQNQDKKSIKHIQNNLKASWLIDSVINELPSSSKILCEANPERALEAALFMIGSCVHIQCERNQTA